MADAGLASDACHAKKLCPDTTLALLDLRPLCLEALLLVRPRPSRLDAAFVVEHLDILKARNNAPEIDGALLW